MIMHVAKINANISKMYRSCEPKDVVERLDKAPLLTLVEQAWWDEEFKDQSQITYPDIKFPFPCFRWHYQLRDGRGTSSGYAIDSDNYELVARSDISGSRFLAIQYNREEGSAQVAFLVPQKKGIAKQWPASGSTDSWPEGMTFDTESKPSQVLRFYLHLLANFSLFYVELGMPVAEVTPKGYIGGHVSWRKRRDYLTIVDTVHKANNPSMQKGATVTHTGEELQRCAHHRRAHWRTLKAAKWGASRGKRIFVKPTWVGPPEWKEGNQTYKIREIPKEL